MRLPFLLSAWTFAALLAGAAAARGELTASHLRDEAQALKAAQANGGAIRFIAQARATNGGWSLETRRLPMDPPASMARFDGPNGVPVPFVLFYDGRRTVSLTLFQGDRQSMVSYESDKLADCNELFVSAAAAGADTAALAGLRLGDLPVKEAPAATTPGGQDVLRIQGGDLGHGFTLTGALTLSWGSARPEGSGPHVLFWGAKAAAPPAGRRASGRVTITAPAPDSFLANGAPTIAAAFAKGGGAVDPAAVLLRLDGADRTAQAEIGPSGLTFTPPSRLLEGKHTAQVIVRAPSGRDEEASVSFTTDTVPPSIAFASPPKVVAGNPAPIIRLTYSDLTSGLDLKTLKVTLDGESIDSICVANLASGVCIPQAIAEGSHLLTATILDRAGNAGTASFAFTLTLNGDSE
ncbi:MAG: choice-of-anchor W domain-containing protein [Thermoanaerobaculia bacterium]